MIKTEQKQVQQDIEVAIECDRCKKVYSKDNYGYHEILRLDFTAGYDSAFGDGYRVQCELCSECLHELISGFCRKSEY
ncbi:hypothetical protein [Endozoicomonas euniceicola]|uniref:Uncharacterized protein n=1 Tax=Endozoicomonas euniceicola TaxID=1234143 RepID=A0ABY6GU51_9GAMM|nr:hypothetical protein [Endozoicomonas euniceicola]UYM16308.1 hypothetical protein NX720_26530 [Endozoicomonas euniceicola]